MLTCLRIFCLYEAFFPAVKAFVIMKHGSNCVCPWIICISVVSFYTKEIYNRIHKSYVLYVFCVNKYDHLSLKVFSTQGRALILNEEGFNKYTTCKIRHNENNKQS